MGQEDGEKWTAAAHLQPAISKSDWVLGASDWVLNAHLNQPQSCSLEFLGKCAIKNSYAEKNLSTKDSVTE